MSRAEELKAQVKGLRRSHRAQAYPAGLRRELTEEARRLREGGLSWHQVGRALGVRGETLERWLALPSMATTPSQVLPVRVVDDQQQPAPTASAAPSPAQAEVRSDVRIISPSGWRVEGLTLKSAARLLKALG